MNQIRKLLQSPVVGWSVATVAILVAGYLLIRSLMATSPYDPARMTQDVVIRFTDTGEEITMSRGRFERELRGLGKSLTVNEGIVNPKTGKPTGFLVAADEWKETVERLNQERADVQSTSPWGSTSTAPSKKP